MSEKCSQDCSSCGQDCAERKEQKPDFTEKLHEMSKVSKVIAVISGKGGVGKSIVTSMLAVTMNRRGYKTAILDADITGPSIPKIFGLKGKATGTEFGLFPVKSKTGIEIMSVNLLLENDTDPVIWRGPIISGTIKQFWSNVIWDNIDYMFLDLPPGTGDAALTVFQSMPIDGIIVVTSPQELVSMIVSKAVKMAEMMNVPIIGLIENFSYFHCPDNGKDYQIFGESHIDEIALRHNLKVLAKLPIQPKIAAACDEGLIELFAGEHLESVADILQDKGQEKSESPKDVPLKIAIASEKGQVCEHFGHCESFAIFYAQEGKIIKTEDVPNPGHKPGFLPNFLHDQGVNVIISGGMGGGAVDIFMEKGIEVVIGTQGEVQACAQAYLAGELETTGEACKEHSHHD